MSAFSTKKRERRDGEREERAESREVIERDRGKE